jgi:signal-transduction protein with cAMP-binding, CBS, and nucleotidyltransferase domain
VTFKQILQDSTQKQRHLYKKFLEQVPVLSPLSVYERLTIADALAPQHFKEGDKIIVEGSEGYEFFIVESGSVICTKLVDGVEKTVSETLGPGDYFGELSLINNENRAATVTAQEDTTCLSIDRKTFKRLLGPLEGMLREHQELYAKYVEDAKSADCGVILEETTNDGGQENDWRKKMERLRCDAVGCKQCHTYTNETQQGNSKFAMLVLFVFQTLFFKKFVYIITPHPPSF